MTNKAKLIRYAGREEKSTWRGGPRKPRKQLQRNDQFTADILDDLMPDIIEPLKMPTREGLEKLASILEHRRGEYWRDQHIVPLEKNIARAAHDLLSTLEKLREKYDYHGGYPPKKIETIDHARYAVGRLFNDWIAVEHSGNLTWRWLANVLPVDFANAIKTTNPMYKIRITPTCPLVRFLYSIVPLLTGEQPTEGTITTKLKDFKKNFLSGKQFGDRIPPPDLPNW